MNKIYIGGTEVANVGSGGGGDMTNYYDKSHIDASYGIIDASLKSFDASIKKLDASADDFRYDLVQMIYLVEDLDSSSRAFDASIRALASSGGGGGGDMSNYATKDDISTFKPIVYTTKDDYDEDVSEGTIDPDSMYVITDLASSDELATLVTIDDLSTARAAINASLNETANAVITAANSSIGYWKTTHVNDASTQINNKKNSAVSAVQSQQTTSVNAVNTAKNTAISDISTQAATITANMKNFVVMTEAEYAQITPDSNTIYFITD